MGKTNERESSSSGNDEVQPWGGNNIEVKRHMGADPTEVLAHVWNGLCAKVVPAARSEMLRRAGSNRNGHQLGGANTLGRYTTEGRKLIQRSRQGRTLRRKVLPVRGLSRKARRTAVGSGSQGGLCFSLCNQERA